MNATKLFRAAEANKGYAVVELSDTRCIEIEADLDTNGKLIYSKGINIFHLGFPSPNASFWKLIVNQAQSEEKYQYVSNKTFESGAEEWEFQTQNSDTLILSRNKRMEVEISVPLSHRAIAKFIDWDASRSGIECLDFFDKLSQIAHADQDAELYYEPGALVSYN